MQIIKIKFFTPFDPAVLLLGIYPEREQNAKSSPYELPWVLLGLPASLSPDSKK